MSDYQVKFDGPESLHDVLKQCRANSTLKCGGRVKCYTWGISFLGWNSGDYHSDARYYDIWVQRRHERLWHGVWHLAGRGDEPAAYWASYSWTVSHLRLLPFRDVLGIRNARTKEWLFKRPELEVARTLDALQHMA